MGGASPLLEYLERPAEPEGPPQRQARRAQCFSRAGQVSRPAHQFLANFANCKSITHAAGLARADNLRTTGQASLESPKPAMNTRRPAVSGCKIMPGQQLPPPPQPQ